MNAASHGVWPIRSLRGSSFRLDWNEKTPDHVTVTRTGRLIDAETHQGIFSWMLERLAQAGLIKGKTIGVDSTTLEANAAMKSIVRRDTGESYMAYFEASGRSRRDRGPGGRVVAPDGSQG